MAQEMGDLNRTDSAIWAKSEIAACISAGVFSGRGGNLLSPKEEISRAEAAVLIRRLLTGSGLI